MWEILSLTLNESKHHLILQVKIILFEQFCGLLTEWVKLSPSQKDVDFTLII